GHPLRLPLVRHGTPPLPRGLLWSASLWLAAHSRVNRADHIRPMTARAGRSSDPGLVPLRRGRLRPPKRHAIEEPVAQHERMEKYRRHVGGKSQEQQEREGAVALAEHGENVDAVRSD